MELPAHLPHLINKPGFYIHMDVFQLRLELELALLYFLPDGSQLLVNNLCIFLGNYALLCQHFGMGNATSNVMAV